MKLLPTLYTPAYLRSLRQRALLSQSAVERHIGISRRTLQHIELGHKRPRYSTLSRLLTLYQTCINTNEARDRAWSV
jgi:transcriptional regulator with XRE-family HTH domain